MFRTLMIRVFFSILLAGAYPLALPQPGFADPTQEECEGLQAAVAAAQSKYNRALAFWRQMSNRAESQQRKVEFIQKQLDANSARWGHAEQDLFSAQQDQAACEAFEKDPAHTPAPLCDCYRVPGRLRTAQNEINRCKELDSELKADLEKAKGELEAFDAAANDAHSEVSATAAALEQAKAAAEGCKHHA